MSKVSDIREICGDYAIDIEYSKDFTFTMYFNSRRNAETVKRCVEIDDSVPNAATAVDFVEVVRCKDCKHFDLSGDDTYCKYHTDNAGGCEFACYVHGDDYCSYGERKELSDKSCDNCAFYNEDRDNQPCCYCAENSCWVKGEEENDTKVL